MRGYAGTPWAEQVRRLRPGPPLWSPFRVPGLDRVGNGGELFVHHEDVRRGEPGWEPRRARRGARPRAVALLGRMGRMLYRSSPVGVVLAAHRGSGS